MLQALAPKRRRLLGWAGAASLSLVGCGGGGDSAVATPAVAAPAPTTAPAPAPVTSTTCSTIPTETGGPYPGDGTNTSATTTSNVLALSGIVRRDITTSSGGFTGTAAGVPLSVTLNIASVAGNCSGLVGYAVYLWHCDRDGNYSLYTGAATNQDYLRGVQVSDAAGNVTFDSIFPACYAGRWPHIHFEIFQSLTAASSGRNSIKTSQLALPADACNAVYATSGYSTSVRNFAAVTLASDGVFSDGTSLQMASIAGSVAAGYSASLRAAI